MKLSTSSKSQCQSNRVSFNLFLVMKNKTIKVILEIVKLVATALLGYFGGNVVL